MIAPNSLTTNVSLITGLEQFADCRDSWNSLAGNRVFHQWEWMFSWWETWQATGELSIVVIRDEADRWIGIAPWFKTRSAGRGNVVRTLGSGKACSDYVSVAVRPGFEAVVADRLVQLITSDEKHEVFSDVDLFEFEGHRQDDQLMNLIRDGLQASGRARVSCEEFAGTWRSSLPETWDEYESRLQKSFRRKTKKAGKRLASNDFQAEVFDTPEEIEKMWPVFVDLHQKRRISLGQPGCFADPLFETFLKSASLRLAESDGARIHLVLHQGQALTTILEFVSGDSICMYQTGVDPDQMSLEPGHINFSWAIRESIERQYKWFDFLRGDEPYKSRWNSTRVPICRTRVVPDRWKSNLRNSLWMTGRRVRQWTRSVIGTTRRPDGGP